MKYAIIADIHANLEAFDVVLRDQKEQRCTHIACLGDIVGYGPDPKECVDIVRALNIPTVKGNHDEYASMEGPLEGFNPTAAKAIEWTRNQLTEDDRRWLRELPLSLQIEDFTLVHATLDGPQRWGYVFDKLSAAANFVHQATHVCFFGHTHVPVAFIQDTVVRGGTYSKFKIAPGKKYFINPGSVGQSRDGVPKATYAILDLDARTIELRRLDYDIATTRAKIRKTGLPPRL
ncbi:metallophosphoesterase [bacterium]|nr:metallophosphoesterase [bacterium]